MSETPRDRLIGCGRFPMPDPVLPPAQHIVRVTITADYHVWSDIDEMTDDVIGGFVLEALPAVVPDVEGDEGAWIGNCKVTTRRSRKRLEVPDA